MKGACADVLPSGALDRFLSEMHPPDWIQAGLLFIAILALLWTARALREQTRARDFENYLSLMEKFGSAWRRLAKAGKEDHFFEFTELMNIFESACHLYNKNVVVGATRKMLREYLIEILSGVFADDVSRGLILQAISNSKTYDQIRIFAEEQGLNTVVNVFDA